LPSRQRTADKHDAPHQCLHAVHAPNLKPHVDDDVTVGTPAYNAPAL
jgi:hypothetical protein